jgi:hypothetical protein
MRPDPIAGPGTRCAVRGPDDAGPIARHAIGGTLDPIGGTRHAASRHTGPRAAAHGPRAVLEVGRAVLEVGPGAVRGR